MMGYVSWGKMYEKQTKEIKGGREKSHGEKKSQEAFDRRKENDIQV